MLKKIKKLDFIPIGVAMIHFLITFLSDELIFELEYINKTNYYGCKVLLFIVLILFWRFIWNIFYKKNVDARKYLKYFLFYFIPVFIIFLFAYPGTWFASDVRNFYMLSVKGEFLYFLNYMTSVFYIVGYMLFPCASGAIILQIILFGGVLSYIVKNFFEIYKNKLIYLLYIPFFMPHIIFYAFYANRPVMFGVCYLLLICLFVIDFKKENKLTFKKLLFISILTAINGFWRSESIYLIGAIPLFVFLVYKEKFNIKNIVKILSLVLICFVIISIPQKIVGFEDKSDIPSSRNLPMFVAPLSYMLTFDLKGDNLEEDLANIDKVLDIELMTKYASYEDTPAIWNEEGCIKEYTKEEYDKFIKSYINVMKNNIPLFLKTKLLTFANASRFFADNFTSKDLYNSDDARLFEREDTRTLFGYKLRRGVYKVLEGKFSDNQRVNIIYRLFGNFLIPMLFIGLIFLHSMIKKKLFYFLLSGMMIGHVCILFLTAPASYFMYYFNIYLCGWILGLIFIIDYYNNFKNRKKVAN